MLQICISVDSIKNGHPQRLQICCGRGNPASDNLSRRLMALLAVMFMTHMCAWVLKLYLPISGSKCFCCIGMKSVLCLSLMQGGDVGSPETRGGSEERTHPAHRLEQHSLLPYQRSHGEWLSEWMNDWVIDRMNEMMNEDVKKGHLAHRLEQHPLLPYQHSHGEWLSEWLSDRMNEWNDEWGGEKGHLAHRLEQHPLLPYQYSHGEWLTEWLSDRMNEWNDEWGGEKGHLAHRMKQHTLLSYQHSHGEWLTEWVNDW